MRQPDKHGSMLHDTTTQGLLAFEASSSSRFSLPKVSLVIPTLNEAENLTLMIPRLPCGFTNF